jgi:hypothetical protein
VAILIRSRIDQIGLYNSIPAAILLDRRKPSDGLSAAEIVAIVNNGPTAEWSKECRHKMEIRCAVIQEDQSRDDYDFS